MMVILWRGMAVRAMWRRAGTTPGISQPFTCIPNLLEGGDENELNIAARDIMEGEASLPAVIASSI